MSREITMIGIWCLGSGTLVVLAVAAAAQPVTKTPVIAQTSIDPLATSSRSLTEGSGLVRKPDDIARQHAMAVIFADDPLPTRSVMEGRLGAKLEHRRTFENYEIFGLDTSGAFGFKFEMTFQGTTSSGLRMDLPGTAWRDAACITPAELRSRLMAGGWGSPGVTTHFIQQLDFRRPGLMLRAEHNNLCVLRFDIVHL